MADCQTLANSLSNLSDCFFILTGNIQQPEEVRNLNTVFGEKKQHKNRRVRNNKSYWFNALKIGFTISIYYTVISKKPKNFEKQELVLDNKHVSQLQLDPKKLKCFLK